MFIICIILLCNVQSKNTDNNETPNNGLHEMYKTHIVTNFNLKNNTHLLILLDYMYYDLNIKTNFEETARNYIRRKQRAFFFSTGNVVYTKQEIQNIHKKIYLFLIKYLIRFKLITKKNYLTENDISAKLNAATNSSKKSSSIYFQFKDCKIHNNQNQQLYTNLSQKKLIIQAALIGRLKNVVDVKIFSDVTDSSYILCFFIYLDILINQVIQNECLTCILNRFLGIFAFSLMQNCKSKNNIEFYIDKDIVTYVRNQQTKVKQHIIIKKIQENDETSENLEKKSEIEENEFANYYIFLFDPLFYVSSNDAILKEDLAMQQKSSFEDLVNDILTYSNLLKQYKECKTLVNIYMNKTILAKLIPLVMSNEIFYYSTNNNSQIQSFCLSIYENTSHSSYDPSNINNEIKNNTSKKQDNFSNSKQMGVPKKQQEHLQYTCHVYVLHFFVDEMFYMNKDRDHNIKICYYIIIKNNIINRVLPNDILSPYNEVFSESDSQKFLESMIVCIIDNFSIVKYLNDIKLLTYLQESITKSQLVEFHKNLASCVLLYNENNPNFDKNSNKKEFKEFCCEYYAIILYETIQKLNMSDMSHNFNFEKFVIKYTTIKGSDINDLNCYYKSYFINYNDYENNVYDAKLNEFSILITNSNARKNILIFRLDLNEYIINNLKELKDVKYDTDIFCSKINNHFLNNQDVRFFDNYKEMFPVNTVLYGCINFNVEVLVYSKKNVVLKGFQQNDTKNKLTTAQSFLKSAMENACKKMSKRNILNISMNLNDIKYDPLSAETRQEVNNIRGMNKQEKILQKNYKKAISKL
ncbi:hypothetical protein COBT_000269 [Conglomerata obtusa]